MFPILTPEQTKIADKNAIESYGIPAIVLMENAARSSAKLIQKIINENEYDIENIAIFCGSGNNGGDGFAIARHLFEIFDTTVFWTGDKSKMSKETLTNYEIVVNLGIEIIHLDSDFDYNIGDFDCIIDAMIGIGGTENIRGITLSILEAIQDTDALKFAIDVPTGLNALTGKANEFCFEADYTLTMFAEKTGLRINDGLNFSGMIIKAYLGAPDFITNDLADIFALEAEDLEYLLPERKKNSSKFDYGKSLIIAGSSKFSGAAALAVNACAKSGAGLTYLYSPTIHSSIFPEVINIRNNESNSIYLNLSDFDFLTNEINQYNSIAIGPGLGDNAETIELIKKLINKVNKDIPLIIDADALRAIDKNNKYRKNIILTPHIGEFSRLTGLTREEITENPSDLAIEWAEKLNCTIVLKGVPTIITDGESTYWNLFGNPSLAKGGTGDVLTGILAALTAKNMDFNISLTSAVAVLVHSLAADNFSLENSKETMLASDIINKLPIILP